MNGKRRASETRFARDRGLDRLVRQGRREGAAARRRTRQDRARAILPGTSRSATRPIPIVIRYVALGRDRIAVGRGRDASRSASRPTRAACAGRSAAAAALARPGTLRLRAPLQPGRFTLTVSANGHTARAAVFVREPTPLSELARLAGPLGCAGLALLLVATQARAPARGTRGLGRRRGRARASTSRRTGARARWSRPARSASCSPPRAVRCSSAGRGCSRSRRSPASRSASPSTSARGREPAPAALRASSASLVARARLAAAPRGRAAAASSARSRSRSPRSSRGPGSRSCGRTTCARARSSSPRSCSRSACWRSASRACRGAGARCSASTGRSSRRRSPTRASGSTSGHARGLLEPEAAGRQRVRAVLPRQLRVLGSVDLRPLPRGRDPGDARARPARAARPAGSPRASPRSPSCGWACCSRSRSRASPR